MSALISVVFWALKGGARHNPCRWRQPPVQKVARKRPEADTALFPDVLRVVLQFVLFQNLAAQQTGDSFQVFLADTVNGTPTIATEGWTYDSTTGSVVFGSLVACNPETGTDINGDGSVGFPDFLLLSDAFGSDVDPPGSGADIDGSGTVDFPDFLKLASNFNKDLPGYQDGNIDLVGGIGFPDFLTLAAYELL